MDRQREIGREDAVLMKKEDKSRIDVENVETTGERCCHLGSFKCYVTQWGWGCQLSRKKVLRRCKV